MAPRDLSYDAQVPYGVLNPRLDESPTQHRGRPATVVGARDEGVGLTTGDAVGALVWAVTIPAQRRNAPATVRVQRMAMTARI